MLHSRIHPIKFIAKPHAQVYVKRDDELGFGVNGTKLRKYQSLLAHIKFQSIQQVVLIGGAYSNNIVSLTQLLIEQGIKPYLFLRGNQTPAYQGNFLLTSLLVPAERIHWIKREAWKKVEVEAQNFVALLPKPALVVPEGACMVEALHGSLSLGEDILINEAEHKLLFDHIFIEVGTGLAAIGLILGLRIGGRAVPIHMLLLAGNEMDFFEKLKMFYEYFCTGHVQTIGWEQLIKDLHFYYPSTGRSFGTTPQKIFDSIVQIARQDGILTDPIYTAKLFTMAREIILSTSLTGPILIIHSGGGLGLMGYQTQLEKRLKEEIYKSLSSKFI